MKVRFMERQKTVVLCMKYSASNHSFLFCWSDHLDTISSQKIYHHHVKYILLTKVSSWFSCKTGALLPRASRKSLGSFVWRCLLFAASSATKNPSSGFGRDSAPAGSHFRCPLYALMSSSRLRFEIVLLPQTVESNNRQRLNNKLVNKIWKINEEENEIGHKLYCFEWPRNLHKIDGSWYDFSLIFMVILLSVRWDYFLWWFACVPNSTSGTKPFLCGRTIPSSFVPSLQQNYIGASDKA